jgi:hypothetical protein
MMSAYLEVRYKSSDGLSSTVSNHLPVLSLASLNMRILDALLQMRYSFRKQGCVIRVSSVHLKVTTLDILHHFLTTSLMSACRADHDKTKKRTVAFFYFRNEQDCMKAELLSDTVCMGRLLDVKAWEMGLMCEWHNYVGIRW